MRKAIITLISAVVFGAAGQAAASGGVEIPKQSWSFEGPFGTYDRAAAQRGLQIYKEVCAGCHSLNLIYYRNLTELGYSEAAVKAFAAEHEVQDGPNEEGEMFMRPAKPSDRFVKPFRNKQAARAANGGALPPDLSLIVEARVGGPNYLYALLTGFHDEPTAAFLQKYEEEQKKKHAEEQEALKSAGKETTPFVLEPFVVGEGMHFNDYFSGHLLAMSPPLLEGGVEFADGTKATVDQMARDITTFLTWASEPNMEARKAMGFKVMLFLVVFCALLIAVKRKVWADVH